MSSHHAENHHHQEDDRYDNGAREFATVYTIVILCVIFGFIIFG